MPNRFDPATHTYYLTTRGAERPVPSVTQIINEVLQLDYHGATDWHKERGTAIHACAARIAQGKEFDYDPQIAGQVAAVRRFFAEVKPVVIAVEQQVYSARYMYAGTYDLFGMIGDRTVLLDWKATVTATVPLQLAGYSTALGEPASLPYKPSHGIGVELRDDGSYKCSEVYDLRRWVNKFLALRSVYGIKESLGLIKAKREET